MRVPVEPHQMRPLAAYEALYANKPRRFAMPSTHEPQAWDAWRTALVAQIKERLGGVPTARSPLHIQTLQSSAHAGYRRDYLVFESAPGTSVPAWLLVPDGVRAPTPAVIAIHGHGYGVDDIVGITTEGTDRAEPIGYQQDFAVALCRRGHVVIAPEMLSFGRRREQREQDTGPEASSCAAPALWGMMLGQPLLGRRVWDVLCALDVLTARPEVDPRRIGVMGISGGGMVALFAAAIEERLRAAVISGYLCTFKESILALDHCLCNYVPGLLQDAEMYDIAALLAPRPLLIEAGARDEFFPVSAVQASYERVRRAYALRGAADHIDQDIFDGAHQISGAKAYDFLWRWLNIG